MRLKLLRANKEMFAVIKVRGNVGEVGWRQKGRRC